MEPTFTGKTSPVKAHKILIQSSVKTSTSPPLLLYHCAVLPTRHLRPNARALDDRHSPPIALNHRTYLFQPALRLLVTELAFSRVHLHKNILLCSRTHCAK